MKIAVDCSLLSKPHLGGVSYFLINALYEWIIRNPDITFILFSFSKINPTIDEQLFNRNNVQLIIKPFYFFKSISFFWFVFSLPFLVKKYKPDIYWSPHVLIPPFIARIKKIITVHDMVFIDYRKSMSIANKFVCFLFYNKSIKKADKIWTVSEYTKTKVENYYQNRKCKNIFVGSSINTKFYKKQDIPNTIKNKILEKYHITGKFILFVGTLEPRKNLKFLLSLMPELSQYGLYLVIVGAKGWGNNKIANIVQQDRYPIDHIIFTGYLPSEDILYLYHLAFCLVSTSLNEGFGLPQLEALSCGCSVVTAHNSAMVEVVQGFGTTVKGWEKEDWISAILNVQSLNEFNCPPMYIWSNIIDKLNIYLLER
jgi:glycosyltransferase involved in cell wall biosynthesis